jgi:3-isopropylmalate/(R)-2-methylmalate dehydratase small subunit
MTPFTSVTAVAAPLLRDNIDTDAIIPSREMRSVTKSGLKAGLFAGWRYVSGRTPNPEFVLNDPERADAQILVAGANFGCGSSREHAVWALAEYGFRAILAESFNPIFFDNCISNGVAPVTLARTALEEIAGQVERHPRTPLTVDLRRCEVGADGHVWPFDISTDARATLLEGLDPIERTLRLSEMIGAFRTNDARARPWVYLGSSDDLGT